MAERRERGFVLHQRVEVESQGKAQGRQISAQHKTRLSNH